MEEERMVIMKFEDWIEPYAVDKNGDVPHVSGEETTAYNIPSYKIERLRDAQELGSKNEALLKQLKEARKVIDLNASSFAQVNMDTSYRLCEQYLGKYESTDSRKTEKDCNER